MKKRTILAILAILVAIIALWEILHSDKNEIQKVEQTATIVGDSETPGWMLHADEPVTLRWYVNFSWFGQGWGENLVSQKITEETGVDVYFLTPEGSGAGKLDALIASDTLPDIITLGWWESQLNEMLDKDMVYALNELADTYDSYFWEVTNPELVSWYTMEDGNIYCYPNSAVTPSDLKIYKISSNDTFLVRKDIYEAIGSPDMTTQEGFEAALKKAVELYPEIDGQPLIPFGVHPFDHDGNPSLDQYLMNFLAVPFEQDGAYYDRFTDPDYLSWLKFFRKMNEEGYLAQDIFVDQRTQIEEKIRDGRYFCLLYQYTDMEAQQKERYMEDSDSIYLAIDGPKNSNGDAHTLPTTAANGWTVTLVSKKCQHPDRAIQFIDYMLSEHGQKMIYLGVEDEMYDIVNGRPVVHKDIMELRNTDRSEYDRLYGADDTYWMLQVNTMQMQWEQETEEPIRQLKEWTYPYVIYNGQYDSRFEPGSEDDQTNEKLTDLWGETLPKLLLAKSDKEFDQIFDEYLQKREETGFDHIMEVKTEMMKEAKQKLGITE